MDRRSSLLARLFAVCGVLLVPWIGLMIWQLHGQAGKRSFSSSWVGLDILEVICLLTVGILLYRGHRATSPVAAATAAILYMDTWFDTMSAAPQLPYAESLAMACFVELPLAALLAWTAWYTLAWAGVPGSAEHRTSLSPPISQATAQHPPDGAGAAPPDLPVNISQRVKKRRIDRLFFTSGEKFT